MKLLVLGGTRFLGRAVVESAIARGHQVTLFNRGQSNPELFPAVERLRGDRDGGLGALRGGTWDAAVDTCGFVPRIVRQSADLLREAVGHYTFVSSCSVYAESSKPGLDESAPVAKLPDESVEEVNGETYGGLKALCERVIEDAFPSRALVVRAGLIVGPHDTTDRFPYWPRRVAQGGEVLAPGKPEAPVQFVDVRDLGDWIVRMAEVQQAGVYNASGPDYALTMGPFLEACRRVTASGARFTWVDESFLLERKVIPFAELPLWVPEANAGFMRFDCRKAWEAGLVFRPLEETIRDTWRWDEPRAAEERVGQSKMIPPSIGREREGEMLREWGAPSP